MTDQISAETMSILRRAYEYIDTHPEQTPGNPFADDWTVVAERAATYSQWLALRDELAYLVATPEQREAALPPLSSGE